MANVVGIHGIAPPDENGADPGVVLLLEDLLQRAKAGEIKAIAAAVVYGSSDIDTRSAASTGYRHFLVAGAFYLQSDLAAESRESK
jgi:hypothetical protein